MIVQCPECDTRYNLDDSCIGPEGSKVRCSRCGHIFSVTRSEESIEDTVDDVFSKAPSFDDDAEEMSSDRDEPHGPSEELESNFANEKPGKKKGRQILLWLVLLVLVLVGVGIGTYYYAPDLLDNTGSGAFTGTKVEEQKKDADTVIPEIGLENVRQYFVKNEKIGQVFVVEGKAVNGFKVPKELIKLRIKLFDDNGSVLESKDFLCGNVVSYFQLQVLNQEELASALSAKVGILTNNTDLKPGTGVPFMVVFPNPPKGLNEFGLETIEAKDPPE
ncbi:DUF3426 domain-containing protein [Desulfoplanes sp.]